MMRSVADRPFSSPRGRQSPVVVSRIDYDLVDRGHLLTFERTFPGLGGSRLCNQFVDSTLASVHSNPIYQAKETSLYLGAISQSIKDVVTTAINIETTEFGDVIECVLHRLPGAPHSSAVFPCACPWRRLCV